MDDMKFANNNISLHKWSLIGFSPTLLLREPSDCGGYKPNYSTTTQIKFGFLVRGENWRAQGDPDCPWET